LFESFLRRFGFDARELALPLAALSAGRRTSACLARCLLAEADLLLDEPTNHLEVEAQRALEATLRGYPGTLVFVSHDRRFLEEFAGRVLDLGESGE
jgi:pleuromutilin/lincosamide/streptogramin A transport system ATP-binding/permease protein